MRLMEYLPVRVYGGQEEVAALQDALQTEVEQAAAARDEWLRQARPSTASWGLAEFEREYGIAPDESKPAVQRLALLRARRRGPGSSTVAHIRSVAQSFTDGAVEVTEYPAAHRFVVRVETEQQAPPDMNDMIAAIGAIQPAHLALEVLHVQRSQGRIYIGLGARMAGVLRVRPFEPEPIESGGRIHLGAAQRWSDRMRIQPMDAAAHTQTEEE